MFYYRSRRRGVLATQTDLVQCRIRYHTSFSPLQNANAIYMPKTSRNRRLALASRKTPIKKLTALSRPLTGFKEKVQGRTKEQKEETRNEE